MNTPSAHQIDLDAYFLKIGFPGPCAATLDTLQTLVRQHLRTIPFENLDPVLHRPVSLDLAALETKLVHSRRGGYCYEQSLLFAHVLDRLGFTVMRLAAQVLQGETEGAAPARTHMLLMVSIDNLPYLTDVGFGGNTPTAPLRLVAGTAQDTPHGVYRLLHENDHDWVLQIRMRNEWHRLYQFDLAERSLADYQAMNDYQSTNDASHFRHSLYAALAVPDPDQRYKLLNERLTIQGRDGRIEQVYANSPDAAADLLLTKFGIQIPDRAAFNAAWGRLR